MQLLPGNNSVHPLPADLVEALVHDKKATMLWNDITPLARNEFICWVENAKAVTTREKRITRTVEELFEGKRRPCCWMGCVHRTDKALSASQKWILDKVAVKTTKQ